LVAIAPRLTEREGAFVDRGGGPRRFPAMGVLSCGWRRAFLASLAFPASLPAFLPALLGVLTAFAAIAPASLAFPALLARSLGLLSTLAFLALPDPGQAQRERLLDDQCVLRGETVLCFNAFPR